MNFATSNKNLVCNMQIRGLEWDFGQHNFVKETPRLVLKSPNLVLK